MRYVSVALTVACIGQARGNFIFMGGDGSKECHPGIVIPAVVQDICTTCGTKSCTICAKCTSGCPTCRHESSVDTAGCLSCNRCADIESNGRCVQCNRKEDGRLPCLGEDRSCVRSVAPCQTAHTIFIPRSVGANTARELVGWEELIHRCTGGKWYITMAHSVGYAHSLRPERIARYLFGDRILRFSGSQVRERGACDFLADNFGLSTKFKGRLEVSPTIENVFFDNQVYVGLDNVLCGLYVRAHAPLVHTKWDLRACEHVEEKKDCKEFPACYMSEGKARATCSIKEALSGRRAFGALREPWHFGRFADRRLTRTGLADIDLIVGWDFLKCDTYHLGIYGLLVAPTGNKPTNRFIFEPIVGNGKHLEVGGGVSGHLILWEEGIDQTLGIYFEGNVTHLFKNRQCRSFDLCNKGPLSRYMLLKEFRREGESVVPTGQLVSGINFTTREVEVSVPVKGDISVKLAYRSPCIGIDLGYNFYGNAREKLDFCKRRDEQLVGIKGTEGTCVLEYATIGSEQPLSFGTRVGTVLSNATQSRATSLGGSVTDNAGSLPLPSDTVAVTALSRQEGLIVDQDIMLAKVSRPPVLLSERDLNRESGTAGATATHKVFGYIGYTFENFCGQRWCIPYLGIGGELEVEALACNEQTSLNQWSIWVKGGLEF
jgi:hypothetical protein